MSGHYKLKLFKKNKKTWRGFFLEESYEFAINLASWIK